MGRKQQTANADARCSLDGVNYTPGNTRCDGRGEYTVDDQAEGSGIRKADGEGLSKPG